MTEKSFSAGDYIERIFKLMIESFQMSLENEVVLKELG
jgi:hypothetical protein